MRLVETFIWRKNLDFKHADKDKKKVSHDDNHSFTGCSQGCHIEFSKTLFDTSNGRLRVQKFCIGRLLLCGVPFINEGAWVS